VHQVVLMVFLVVVLVVHMAAVATVEQLVLVVQ
jgi:hypothetical protein